MRNPSWSFAAARTLMGFAEFISGPAEGRTRWLNPSYTCWRNLMPAKQRRCGRTFDPRRLDRLAPFCGNELLRKNSVRSMDSPPQDLALPAGIVTGGPMPGRRAERGEFPVPTGEFPVRAKKFPAPAGQGIGLQHTGVTGEIGAWKSRNGGKFAKFPVKFPATGNSRIGLCT